MLCITAGELETVTDMMRSILAQLEFKYQILEWEKKGVPFRQYIYVPEIHPVSKQVYCDMGDEAHVLKVCVCTFYLHVALSFKHATLILTETSWKYKERWTRQISTGMLC